MSLPGRAAGITNLRDAEIASILAGVKKRLPEVQAKKMGMLHLYELVGEETGFDWHTVQRIWRMMQPTTGLAVDFIRARAFKLARRVVKEASVSEALDILSRPNIGVLDPIKRQESGGGGFFISVQADSCGAVNVGIQGSQPQPQLSEAQPAIEAVDWSMEGEGTKPEGEGRRPETLPVQANVQAESLQVRSERKDAMARHRPRAPGNSKAYEQALEAARVRLEIKRKRAINYARRRDAKAQGDQP